MKLFAIGGVFWALAIGIKLVMDLTFTTPLYISWQALGQLTALLLLGLYVGMRTGLLECIIPFLGFRTSALRGISIDEAIAVGVGFGATEAIVLAFPSLVQMLAMMINPAMLAYLTPDQAAIIEAQLDQPTYMAFAAVWERAFVIIVHAFATLLTFLAAVRFRWRLLLGAILFKAALDGPLPIMQAYVGTSGFGIAIIEAFVAIMGLLALYGIISLRERHPAAGVGKA